MTEKFLILEIHGSFEAFDDLGKAGVLAFVLAQLARVVVESPRFRDFHRHKFDDDVHRLDALEIFGEMGSDAE